MFQTVNVHEKHLIPYRGDETLLIDRYDVRLLFENRKQFENIKEAAKHRKPKKLSDREKELERKTDKERYWDMMLHEEEMYKGRLQGRKLFYLMFDLNAVTNSFSLQFGSIVPL